jgi:hypothetical protein
MADTASDLRRVAGLVFDQAARRWYAALGLEAVSAVLSAVIAVALAGQAETVSAGIAVLLLLVAYALRLSAEGRHDIATTMNRQAALSNGLGWRISKAQLDEWRRRAGRRTLEEAEERPLDAGYYSSTEPPGPRRMAEITLETAFYTRGLWLSMRGILVAALIGAGVLAAIAAWVSLAVPVAAGTSPVVAQVVVTGVLVVVSLDTLGWVLRLGRQETSVADVIRGLDRVIEASPVSEADVLRLVSEYDCETAGSMPLLKAFIDWRHDDIAYHWERRTRE